jgi:heme-degrading monooxygenase HmoA
LPQQQEEAMFAVIFAVQPFKERWNDYLELAKFLKPKLEAIDGFIDNERFESERAKGRLLSLSTWRDEKAVVRWRTLGEHRGVQERGRFEIFEDYQLSIGEITQDSDPPRGLTVVEQRFDETAVGPAKAATIVELTPRTGSDLDHKTLPTQLGLDSHREGLVNVETFASIYNPGKVLLMARWRDAAAADAWSPRRPASAEAMRVRQVRIIRDYGMFDRREAPQFFQDVQRRADVAAE